MKYCIGCMGPIENYPCPRCGFRPEQYAAKNNQLPPETILNGKYLIGRVLGQGGFGITYMGLDLPLNMRVAIKEFYPSGSVMRDPHTRTTLYWDDSEKGQEMRRTGVQTFLKEARKMAKVTNIPGVVNIREVFAANDTAYIAMEYVKGSTLQELLKKNGPMTWEQTRNIFLPAVAAMEQVHNAGLIHRDLSPDNLMIQPDGTVKILDLGAAKDLSTNSGASSMVVAKNGFSPVEQYTQRGGSGPWTDVYAMAASIYYTLTGTLPPLSIERMEEDTIDWDRVSSLPPEVLAALKSALEVFAKKRMQSMTPLRLVLEEDAKRAEAEAAKAEQTRQEQLAREQQEAAQRAAAEEKRRRAELARQEKEDRKAEQKAARKAAPKKVIAFVSAAAVVLALVLFTLTGIKKAPTEASIQSVPDTITAPRETEPQSLTIPISDGCGVLANLDLYKGQRIASILFLGNVDSAPNDAQDVSENSDGSVMAWLDDKELNVATRRPKVIAPVNSSQLFGDFSDATAIDCSALDTSQVADMSAMFNNCGSLTALDVSGFDTSAVTDMRAMFERCGNLTTLDVSGFDTSAVTDMGFMFNQCGSLTTLDVSGFKTAAVTNMVYMFNECSSLTTLDVSGFDTSAVTHMWGMFGECSSLTTLDVSDFNTSAVTSMLYMFYNCSSLTTLDVSGFDTSAVTNMGYMFSGCRSLTTLDVSNFDTSAVTRMGDMFSKCSNLTKLITTDQKILNEYQNR